MDIPFEIISSNLKDLDKTLAKARKTMQKECKPYALIIRKGIFEKLVETPEQNPNIPSREEAIKTVIKHLKGDEIIVSTTGKISRELYENRENKEDCKNDFYNIGAMGCAQSLGLGIALNKKDKKIVVLDGDGSVLMQMGALATIGHHKPENFYHIIFDNQAHDSTGGQPTCSDTVCFEKISLACGYKKSVIAKNLADLEKHIEETINAKGPSMIVIKVKKGARKELGRPPLHPKDYKKMFMKKKLGK